MAPKSKSIFRQPGARHFQLVHRSQRDPLINDPEASQHVLKPIDKDQSRKGKSRADIESDLSPDVLAHDLSRANIGEAAAYGVYYDDTDYDYMQHLKPVGLQEEGVESVLIEAPDLSKAKKKGKGKDTDIFRDIPSEALPSASELPRNYASQEAIPSEISGLQPDMDPHLRQTLEALEDDAFVDDAVDDDFFDELVAGGEREDADEEVGFEFREDGLEGEEDFDDNDEDDEDWEARFAKFKRRQATERTGQEDDGSDVASDMRSEGGDTVGALPKLLVVGGKRRRKGTSDASGYSMSSSSMFRNEGLTLLDERFDQIEKQYESDEAEEEEEDSDDDAPDLITSREDFNKIMDEFLENYEILGGKMRQALPGETATDKLGVVRDSLREHVLNLRDESDEEQSDEPDGFMMEEKDDSWDCETILSTYSNMENRPKVITERRKRDVVKIELDPKTGLPTAKNSLPTKKAAQSAPQDDVSEPQMTISRPKDETKEEKRARKRAVKDERQVRRSQKKITKEYFSNERKHQLQVMSHMEKGIKKL